MASTEDGSVTRWIDELRDGDDDAARGLWDAYFQRMVQLARARLKAVGNTSPAKDEEDAALSAFVSLCEGLASGRYASLGDRQELWRLLVVITARKVQDQAEHERRQKRGGGRVVSESALRGNHEFGFDQLVGPEPTPEFIARVAEETNRLLDALEDKGLRQIALWRMEGYSAQQVADRLACSVRTISTKLTLIRKKWECELS